MNRRRVIALLSTIAVTAGCTDALATEEGAPVDRIIIEKSARTLTLMAQGEALRVYDVALGFAPEGHKQQEGDGRTPEGVYSISGRNADSAFHLSLRISYPNDADKKAAAARGVSPGGDIFIHGAPNWWVFPGQPPGDWTRGCIAVTNAEIEEIWRLVTDGTLVEIRP